MMQEADNHRTMFPETLFTRAFEDDIEGTIVVMPTAKWRGMHALGVGHESVLRR